MTVSSQSNHPEVAPLHPSLRLRNNVLLMGIYFACLLGWLCFVRLTTWQFLIAGLAAGFIAGVLQSQSINEKPQAFLEARTALDVRKAMLSTRSGRLFVPFYWGFALCLAAASAITGHLIPGLVSGMMAFYFMRESATLPTTAFLSRLHQDRLQPMP
jgi:multisubunit Na+/H+ antiporter MnhE subunit